MADKKISALTASTTPLAGTEVLPIVQGGSTVKVSVANLTAGRDTTVANLLTNGDITVRNAGSVIVGYAQNSGGWFDFAGSTNVNGTQISSGAATPVRVLPAGAETVRFQTNGDVTLQLSNLVMAWPGKGIDFSANTHAAGMTSELLNDYEEGTWTPNQGGGLTVVGAFTSSGTYTKIGRQVTVTGSSRGATSIAVGAGSNICTNLPFTVGALGGGGTCVNDGINASSIIFTYSTIITSTGAVGASPSLNFTATYFV